MRKLIIWLGLAWIVFASAFRAYAQQAFHKIQISNPENTPGTAEAATEVLLGKLTVKEHDKVFHNPDQDRGVLARNYETPFQVADEIELEFEGELYDRLAVFLFCMAVRGNITPTQPDNINEPLHYLWDIVPGMTTGNTPDITNGIDTFTLEYGDTGTQAFETEYLYAKSLEITGEPNEPVMISATFGGRQVTDTTFTGALTAPAAAYFPFNLTKFYIGSTYASLAAGTATQMVGMLRAFTINFDTMFTELRAADGNLHFTGLKEDKKFMGFELTFWVDDTNHAAELVKFKNQSLSYIRIELLSHTEMDSGQDNPPYIYIDAAVRFAKWGERENEDGTMTTTVSAESAYDATSGEQFSVQIGTTMSAFA